MVSHKIEVQSEGHAEKEVGKEGWRGGFERSEQGAFSEPHFAYVKIAWLCSQQTEEGSASALWF